MKQAAKREFCVTLSNGVRMPQIGLGVMHMLGTECEEAICEAVDAGYRLIDTAAIYGNEEAVGKGIRASAVTREELFVTTKLWVQDADYKRAKTAYDISLQKLGLDYVDLYLIHQPVGDVYGAWHALEELYEEGKVRAIGVSNLNIGRLVDLSIHNHITPHVCQMEIHPYYQQKQAVPEMQKMGIQPQGWAPLASGRNNLFRDKTLAQIGQKYGKTPAQVALRWSIQRGIAVIPKSSKTERIHENINVWDFSLSAKEMEIIAGLDNGEELFFQYDSPELVRMFESYRLGY